MNSSQKPATTEKKKACDKEDKQTYNKERHTARDCEVEGHKRGLQNCRAFENLKMF